MELFSQRKGIKPVKSVIQVDSVDKDLRVSLWNALTIYYWNKVEFDELYLLESSIWELIIKIWVDYLKEPIDTLGNSWENFYRKVRGYYFTCQWYEVYDFIEFIANTYPDAKTNQEFMNSCNFILESELSAYRFVGGKITQITSEEEISEIEEALEVSESLKTVNLHLKRALELLSDRKNPDYRNSIKESISAVEAICRLITQNDKATLGQALKEVEKKVGLHSALKNAFSSLYGYTSDAEGIRHALLDEPNLSFEDAKFMLVSCSAFINWLISKATKAGFKIRPQKSM
jgi:hypothetical protein